VTPDGQTVQGFTFRPRRAKGRDAKCWTSFLPAVSAAAMKRIYQSIREWHLPRQTSVALHELAVPIVADRPGVESA
jgi:RNA-directed DNA polymerase